MSGPAKAGGPRSVGAVRSTFAPWNDADARPILTIEGVTRRFGSVTAVDGLNLTIYEREFFCLLGPSGCGKTTLMRMIAGFEQPDEGRILLAGEDIIGMPPHRRPINMMFQSYALFPHMSVRDNIAFGLKQEGMERGEIEARVEEMLSLVQLTPLAGRRPHQLSGGQKQRAALARSLAKRPKVLLLDEPLGALDKKLREETQFQLMDLQTELGTTFIVVTHDQEEAMIMADRIAVMDKGHIVQVATPEVLYEQPRSRFIAEFVGEVNLFEGTVTARGDGLWTVTGSEGQLFHIDDEDEKLSVGQAVAVAVRPEKMSIARKAHEDAANVMNGEVWDIGYLGDWTVYRVKLASGQIVRVTRANARRHVDDPIGWDEAVEIAFSPEAGIVLTD